MSYDPAEGSDDAPDNLWVLPGHGWGEPEDLALGARRCVRILVRPRLSRTGSGARRARHLISGGTGSRPAGWSALGLCGAREDMAALARAGRAVPDWQTREAVIQGQERVLNAPPLEFRGDATPRERVRAHSPGL